MLHGTVGHTNLCKLLFVLCLITDTLRLLCLVSYGFFLSDISYWLIGIYLSILALFICSQYCYIEPYDTTFHVFSVWLVHPFKVLIFNHLYCIERMQSALFIHSIQNRHSKQKLIDFIFRKEMTNKPTVLMDKVMTINHCILSIETFPLLH
eukprot:457421_1